MSNGNEPCIGRETIGYAPDAGPVVLEIGARFATRGRYRVAILVDEEWRELEGGDVADAEPDLRVIPIAGVALADAQTDLIGLP